MAKKYIVLIMAIAVSGCQTLRSEAPCDAYKHNCNFAGDHTIMSRPTIVSDTFRAVDNLIETFVFSAYNNLAMYIGKFMPLCLTIVILTMFLRQIINPDQVHAKEVCSLVIKISGISLFLTVYSPIFQILYEMCFSFADGSVAALSKGIDNKFFDFSNGSMHKAIQRYFDAGWEFSTSMLSSMGIRNWVPGLLALMGLVITIMVCVYATFVIILAKVGLAITLALTPIFVSCSIFPQFRGLTESWVRHLIGFILIPVGTYSILLFIFCISESVLLEVTRTGTADYSTSASYFFVAVLSLPLLAQTKSMMSSIASGFSFGAMNLSEKTKSAGKAIHFFSTLKRSR